MHGTAIEDAFILFFLDTFNGKHRELKPVADKISYSKMYNFQNEYISG